jgi:Family of unknown function (DUF5719)
MTEQSNGHRDAGAPPAHGRRDRRRPARGRSDPRSLATRLPVVLVLAAVIVGAVAVDARDDRAGTSGAPAIERPPAGAETPVMPATPGASADSSTWYCAAGTAEEGGFADHTIAIQNPSPRDLEATLTVYPGELAAATPPPETTDAPGASAPEVERVAVPAGERVVVRLADVVQAPLAAALVEVDGGDVAVEHRVAGEHGEDAAPCSTFAAPAWHFAWGSTARDAREIVVLFNPFPSAATVDASFVTEDGGREPVRFQGLPVPPGSVVGVDLGADVTRAEQVAATFRVRSGRVVAERLQQYDGSLGPEGLALTLGTPTAGTAWVFADGEASAGSPATPAPEDRADPRDDRTALVTTERIVVYNPGEERAEVDVSPVPTGNGTAPQPFGLSIGPGRYEIVDYGGQLRIEPGVPHATVVRSTNGQPVVVERVLLDEGPVPARAASGTPRPGELAAALGARLAARGWRLPSVGDIGGRGRTVDLVVFNPDADAARRVDVTLAPVDPGAAHPAPPDPVDVAPGARVAIPLDDAVAAAAGAAVVLATGPVVVERVVRAADGRRVSAQAAIPIASGAVSLDTGP